MDFIHQFWPHISFIITVISGWLARKKVVTAIIGVIKWLAERSQPEHFKALEAHEKRDDERFTDVKAYIGDVKAELIQAVAQNVGYLREDLKTERASAEKRFEFLEKVYLDSRLDKS